jgi:hypothetical protein
MKTYLAFAFMVGIIVGYKLPPGTFKPWDLDGRYYGGELVKHVQDKFYTLCNKGKVVYVYNQDNILVNWTECKDVNYYDGSFHDIGLDLHSSRQLVLQ